MATKLEDVDGQDGTVDRLWDDCFCMLVCWYNDMMEKESNVATKVGET